MAQVQEIEKEFTYKGEPFVRLFENNDWYVYKRLHGGLPYYEVFRKKIVDKIDFNTKQPTGETKYTYPKDHHFGVWAWCCRSLDRALSHIT